VKTPLGSPGQEAQRARNAVILAADAVLRTVAPAILERARDLRCQLKAVDAVLGFMRRPEQGSADHDRIPQHSWSAQRERTDSFADTEIAIQYLLEGRDEQLAEVRVDLTPWIEARAALIDNADAPLPEDLP
jgi:hypothetical protein